MLAIGCVRTVRAITLLPNVLNRTACKSHIIIGHLFTVFTLPSLFFFAKLVSNDAVTPSFIGIRAPSCANNQDEAHCSDAINANIRYTLQLLCTHLHERAVDRYVCGVISVQIKVLRLFDQAGLYSMYMRLT